MSMRANALILIWGIAACLSVPAQQNEPVVITVHPTDQTVEVGHRATFSVQATGSDLRYIWFANDARIAGAASSPVYTSPLTTFAMSGNVYHVVVSNAVNVSTSAPARLTVVPDVTGPQPTNAFVSSVDRIDVRFDEPLLQSSVQQSATNYAVFLLGSTNKLRVTNVFWGVTQLRVVVDRPLFLTNRYVLCMANIADMHTNVISPNPACVAVGFPTTNTLISLREVWRYNENETNGLSDEWRTLEYDDDPLKPPYHWADGYGAFVYASSGPLCSAPGTALSIGPTTYYFRKRFVTTEVHPADAVLTLRHLVDDGAVFYLNGTEIHRAGLPGGTIDYTTRATRVDKASCLTVMVPSRGLLTRGTNILAVEVHQAVEPSRLFTDVEFDTEMSVTFLRAPVIPRLQVTYTPSAAILRWNEIGWSLETASSIAGPWSRVATTTNEHISPASETGQQFFRLTNP